MKELKYSCLLAFVFLLEYKGEEIERIFTPLIILEKTKKNKRIYGIWNKQK